MLEYKNKVMREDMRRMAEEQRATFSDFSIWEEITLYEY